MGTRSLEETDATVNSLTAILLYATVSIWYL